MRILIAFILAMSLAACGGKSDTPSTPIFSNPSAVTLAVDQVVFDSTRESANREIFVMKNDGTGIQRLTTNAGYEHWWPRISPDRKKVLFYRRPAGVATDDYAQASLWVMNADGTGITQLIAQGGNGWSMQGHGEWSPDGTKIAMFGSYLATLQVFVVDVATLTPVRFTNQAGVKTTDVAWSPDGSKLLFNSCPISPCTDADLEIYVTNAIVPLTAPTRLTTDTVADFDPYFSPDGSTVAWLTTTNPAANAGAGAWGIRMAEFDSTTTALQNIRALIDDGQINSKPAWSLDGATIFFHRMNLTEEGRFGVFKIRSDGTQVVPTRLTTINTGINEFPAN